MLPRVRSLARISNFIVTALPHYAISSPPLCVLESFPCCCLCASLKKENFFAHLLFPQSFPTFHFCVSRSPLVVAATHILSYCQQRKRDSENVRQRAREREVLELLQLRFLLQLFCSHNFMGFLFLTLRYYI